MNHDDYDAWLRLFTDRGFDRPRINDGPDQGWWPLIGSLLDDLKAMGFSKANLQITQVKEKFGGLRFYVYSSPGQDSATTTRVYERIYDAERQSYVTCERCGQPGALRAGNWLKTLCDEHANGRAVTSLA